MVGRWDQLRFQHGHADQIDDASNVYINRNLKLNTITHMGFDMDHTLAVYTLKAQELAFNLTRDKLVKDFKYPKEVSALEFEDGLVIRGLIIDKKRGNLIKLDTHKYVEVAYHGLTVIPREERKELYNLPGESYRPSSEDYAYLDTLFCLPEACLYVKLVDLLDRLHEEGKLKRELSYQKISSEVRQCIDGVHRNGSLKSVIIENLPLYIEKDPALPKTLLHFIQGGKRLFLLTNSEYYYTNIIMTYLLNDEVPGYDNWQDYFDFIIVSACKPGFFLNSAELEKLDVDEFGVEIPKEVCPKVYRGGYFKNLEERLGAFGESILYFGDHTFGDILKSKQTCGWRTVMVILELEDEINILNAKRTDKDNLDMLRSSLTEIREEVSMLEAQITHMRNRKLDYYEDLVDSELEELDQEMRSIRKVIASNEDKATECLKDIKRLERYLDSSYNEMWGCLFKSRRRKSRFGDQVEDFACLYTARITNFSNYPTTKYFRISHDSMAHERHAD